MSAIKTHDLYDVVHGDDILFTSEDETKKLKVRSLVMDRRSDRRDICQIFAETENKGSLPTSDMKVLNCKITNITPDKTHYTFAVDAMVGKSPQSLSLKAVKSSNQNSCIIS